MTRERMAVVIGGGNGIGEATCRLMSARGWHVVVADCDAPAALRVARDIGGAAVEIDLCDAEGVERAAAEMFDAQGVPTALVVAAAVFQDVLPPEALPLPMWERTLEVNLTGTWLANRSFGVRMAAHGGGSIVNIASIAAIASMPVHAYGTSSGRRSADAQPRR